ncbi:hypothetical protein BaRGS_00028373 [Batillaria attramentaria]|uniref:Uncharacterized protein n=1 Tax=Batillaria attramentaria TaxID=370345 RepID=A0ABD0K003_9CAEN
MFPTCMYPPERDSGFQRLSSLGAVFRDWGYGSQCEKDFLTTVAIRSVCSSSLYTYALSSEENAQTQARSGLYGRDDLKSCCVGNKCGMTPKNTKHYFALCCSQQSQSGAFSADFVRPLKSYTFQFQGKYCWY